MSRGFHEVGDLCWSLPLWRGGRCRKVSITVFVFSVVVNVLDVRSDGLSLDKNLHCLFLPRYSDLLRKTYQCWRLPCDGLASHPGGVVLNAPSCFMVGTL